MEGRIKLPKCPICNEPVPCISEFVTVYCMAMHIASKWDDEPHVRWRKEHGITPTVYQSMAHVQTMVRQIMAVLPQHDMSKVWSKSYKETGKLPA